MIDWGSLLANYGERVVWVSEHERMIWANSLCIGATDSVATGYVERPSDYDLSLDCPWLLYAPVYGGVVRALRHIYGEPGSRRVCTVFGFQCQLKDGVPWPGWDWMREECAYLAWCLNSGPMFQLAYAINPRIAVREFLQDCRRTETTRRDD